jgi:hypothetical protein
LANGSNGVTNNRSKPPYDRSAVRAEADPLNRTVRSLFTSPERGSFKPTPLLAPPNILILQDFDNRTKTGVVRLRQRKGAKRGRKRPKIGFGAGTHGSDKWPRRPAFCAIPAGGECGEKNVSTETTGGGRGTVVEPSLCAGRPADGSRCKFGTLKT